MGKKGKKKQEATLAVGPDDSQSSQTSAQSTDKPVDWQDVAKRALADLDNYKKQAEKDKFEMLNIMKAASLAKFMEVYDDLARAVDSMSQRKSAPSNTVKNAAALDTDGLRNVQKKFKDFLTSEGLETIEYKAGDEFNPEFAEAVTFEDNEHSDGVMRVIETMEVGLKYKDRVVKPAKVRVGK